MSISMKRSTARFASAAGALIGAGALTFMSVLPANAAGSITDPISNEAWITGVSETVAGTTDSSATYYAIAICDASSGGTKCDATPGAYTNLTAATGSFSIGVVPNATFSNFNFATQSPGTGSTDCSVTQCAVILSQYSGTYPAVTPLGAPVVVPVDIS